MNAVHVVVAMKPLEGDYFSQSLKLGIAGFNIDGCRVGTNEDTSRPVYAGTGNVENWITGNKTCITGGSPLGRWPANIIHDGSEDVVEKFPDSNGENKPKADVGFIAGRSDSGSASRFFKECK
jgi:site-specific DNA-methyltransferase (adenine-specific)